MLCADTCSQEVGWCAGMMTDNRDAVETAFKNGVISVLVATSTVATGVNLPAQRVIIRDNYIGRRENLLNSSRLRQMAGRAGRSGIDTKGECVCVLQNTSPAALNRMKKLMTAPVRTVSPCSFSWHELQCCFCFRVWRTTLRLPSSPLFPPPQ